MEARTTTLMISRTDWNDRETHAIFVDGDDSPLATGDASWIVEEAARIATGVDTYGLTGPFVVKVEDGAVR